MQFWKTGWFHKIALKSSKVNASSKYYNLFLFEIIPKDRRVDIASVFYFFSSWNKKKRKKWRSHILFLSFEMLPFTALNSQKRGNLLLGTSKTVWIFSDGYPEAYSVRIQLKVVNVYRKTLHFRFLTGFWIRLYLPVCNYPSIVWLQSFTVSLF